MDQKTKLVWNPFDKLYINDPYPHLQKCREENPIQKTLLNNWIFFKYQDVSDILASNKFDVLNISEDFSKKEPYIFKGVSACPYLAATTKKWPMHINGAEHKVVRKLLAKAVNRVDINLILDESLVQLLQKYDEESEIDLSTFSCYFQYLIIKKIYGLKEVGTFEKVRKFSNMLAKLQDSLTPKQVHVEINSWLEWGKQLFQKSAFRDDILMQCKEIGIDLSDDDLYSMLVVSMAATFETTKDTLAFALLEAMKEPAILERVLAYSDMEMQSYVEEIFRLFSPAQYTIRINNEDFHYKNVIIPKNSRIFLCIASANRDTDIFISPNEIMINRTGNKHIAFGKGTHFCLGAQLARKELAFSLRPMLQFLKDKGCTNVRDVKYKNQIFIRAFESIKLTSN